MASSFAVSEGDGEETARGTRRREVAVPFYAQLLQRHTAVQAEGSKMQLLV